MTPSRSVSSLWAFLAILGFAASSPMPLVVNLPAGATRCIHEYIPEKNSGTVEVFVESGGKLEIHLIVKGPVTKGWGGVPEETDRTETLIDKVITNSQEEDFDDSFLFTFESKGGHYQACVANDMSHIVTKNVQFDLHTGYSSVIRSPSVKLVTDGESAELSEEEKKKISEREKEIANLEKSIKNLKAGLKKVRKQQAQERHRQVVHSSVSEDNNNRMVIGSLIETVVFIGAAAFQIFFVRAWFENKQAKTWA